MIFSELVVIEPSIDIIPHMHSFIVKFDKILDILKGFAGNRVCKNDNHLSKRLNAEEGDMLPNLIPRRQYNQRRKLIAKLKLSSPIRIILI